MKDGEPCLLNQNNPSRETLDLIADKWAVLVIFALREGERRFAQLHRDIEGITQKMLIQTLRGMERDGLVERKVYPVIPPKVEYRLSPLGLSLKPLLALISDWSKANLKKVHAARQRYDRARKKDAG
ncbi:putative transcriptional regulator [Opitutaceae bacterium TAV1]|nr:putative transcriptional regulator [Opitutaceae bacterium TAV1]